MAFVLADPVFAAGPAHHPRLPASVATEAPHRPERWHVGVSYFGDTFANVNGGLQTGATYQGRLGLIIDANLDALVGWRGATAHASVHQIHGTGITAARVGAVMAVSGIEAEPATRLFNLWIEQDIGKAVAVRAGQFTAGQEFVISTTAATFVNSTFGWPAILAQDLPSGGPAYPLATLGARIAVSPGGRNRLLAAIFNGDPAGPGGGDPQRRDRSGFNGLRLAGPPIAIVEVQSVLAGEVAAPTTMLRFGGWVYFGRVDNRTDAVTGVDASKEQRRNFGGYVVLDQQVTHRGPRKVDAFLRLAASPSDRNPVNLYADGGLTITGPFRRRPDDIAGIAIGISRLSTSLIASRQRIATRELVVELTYEARITPQWVIQPDIQYIVDPAAVPGTRDALVIGLRNSLRF